MCESVSLSRRRTQGTGGMGGKRQHGGESRRDGEQTGQRVFGVWTDGSKPYLFYRGAVHCVMLDEKEQRISSRGRAFGFVVWGGGDE